MSDARPPIPYDFLPPVAEMTLASADLDAGSEIPDLHLADSMGMTGDNVSPELHWSGAPEGTQSYAITCHDPDAPTASGFWHWVVFDIPADVSALARGAGASDATLPAGAHHARNDAGALGYLGAAPPEGHGEHRYVFVVHAVDQPTLGLDSSATPAAVGFTLAFNTLARGLLVATYER
jgi:Raf kinase inhibitor-like YbhB/YbcL family protein